MNVDAFDFVLPERLIAQSPLSDRASSRLMVLDRDAATIAHHIFSDMVDHVGEGDVIVVNDTKVIPARLLGQKTETQGAIELLLLHEIEPNTWQCLAKPVRRLHVGTVISFGPTLQGTIQAIHPEGIVDVHFLFEGIFLEILDALGEVPLPPYIKAQLEDPDRYQTVYANAAGSAAAPTAGLHFTNELLDQLRQKGATIASITLHVGLGTFRPVKVEDTKDHIMHAEFYQVSDEAARLIQQATRVIAVGTTVMRTLETMWATHQAITPCQGWSTLFITPGFEFGVVDSLITNFHLPKSTLMMLVSAFSSMAFIQQAYQLAIQEEYRFFSFGDAMWIR